MKKVSLALAACLTLAACGDKDKAKEMPLSSQYFGYWYEADLEVTMAIAKTPARCGYLYYKNHIEEPQRAIAYCSDDGETWSAWWISRSGSDPRFARATGPFRPDPGLPPPKVD